MTDEEVYQELERDREYVTRWWRHTLSDQRRRVLKCEKFPLTLWFDYTSKRKNRYLFFTRIFDKKMKAILTGIGVLRHTKEGLAVYTSWLQDQKLISPMVLTPHMFKQYASEKRCNVKKTGIDLIKHYFTHNSHGKDNHNQDIVGRSVRYNGETHLSCCVDEGVLLGQKHGDLFIARTFITYQMCGGLQLQEFESSRKEILTDRELYDKAKEYYRSRLFDE